MELIPVRRLFVEGISPEKRPPIYDITTQRDMAPSEDSICKTCVNRFNRRVKVEGGDTRPCNPTEWNVTMRLFDDGCQTRTDEHHVHKEKKSVALVESCGYRQKMDCKTCTHFVELTHGNRQFSDFGGWRKHVVVAGYCGLPAEGVKLANGQVKHCLPEKKLFTILDEQSCDNCANCAQAQPWAEFQGVTELFGTIVRTGADPWEQSQSRKAYAADPEGPKPRQLNFRIVRQQAKTELGFISTYLADVVDIDDVTRKHTTRDGQVVVTWHAHKASIKFGTRVVHLSFSGNEAKRFETSVGEKYRNGEYIAPHKVQGMVPAGQIMIERSVDPDKLIVHMQNWPWRKLFGVPERKVHLYYDPLVRAESFEAPKPFAGRAENRCPRCRPYMACDYHARLPEWQKLWDPVLKKETDVITFADPNCRDPKEVASDPSHTTVYRNGRWESISGGPQKLAVLRHQMYRLSIEARRLVNHGGSADAEKALYQAWVEALTQRIPKTSKLKQLMDEAKASVPVHKPPGFPWDWLSEWQKREIRQVRLDWETALRNGTLEYPGRHLAQAISHLPIASYDTRGLAFPVLRPGEIHTRDDAKKFDREIFWEDGPWMIYHRPSMSETWPSGTLESRKYYCFAYLHGEEGLDLPKIMGIRDMGESFWGPTTQLAHVDPRSLQPGSGRPKPTYTTGEFHRYDVDDYLQANDLGARVQESIDAALFAGNIWDPFTYTWKGETPYGPPVPEECIIVRKYDAFGVEVDYDNWPEGYDRKTDQVEYARWLDEETMLFSDTGHPDMVSNRWRFYGPDACLTGAARPEHRDVSVDAVWGEDPAWHWEYDDAEDAYEDELEHVDSWEPIDENILDSESDDTGLDITDAMHEEAEVPWRRYEIICLECAKTANTPEEAVVGSTIAEVVKPTQTAECPQCKKHNTIYVELIGDDGTRGGERGFCPRCHTIYRGVTPVNDICAVKECDGIRLVMVDEGIQFEALEKHRKIRVFRSSDDKIQRRQLEHHGSGCGSWVRAERGARRYDDNQAPTTPETIEIRRNVNNKRLESRRRKRGL